MKQETTLHKWTKEIIHIALIIAGVFAFKWTFIANYTVPTSSMFPEIMPGDRLVVNKMAYDLRIPFTNIQVADFQEPSRGDIVVFDYPLDPSINYVKRLIGLPGDKIEVTDGFITVNGISNETPFHDQYETMKILTEGGRYEEKAFGKTFTVQRLPLNIRHEGNGITQKYTVPEGQYFFMGDNRDNSADSRKWGFVPRKYIRGKALWVYISFDSQTESFLPTLRTDRFGKKLN